MYLIPIPTLPNVSCSPEKAELEGTEKPCQGTEGRAWPGTSSKKHSGILFAGAVAKGLGRRSAAAHAHAHAVLRQATREQISESSGHLTRFGRG